MFSYNSSQGCGAGAADSGIVYLPGADVARAPVPSRKAGGAGGTRALSVPGRAVESVSRAVRPHARQASLLRDLSKEWPPGRGFPALGIDDLSSLPVAGPLALFRQLKFKGREAEIARDIIPGFSASPVSRRSWVTSAGKA
jgi:hypothetical protein